MVMLGDIDGYIRKNIRIFSDKGANRTLSL